jgi:adenylate cyclase
LAAKNEFNQAQAMVDRLVNERQGGLVLLVGEGGMGKSRLTSELKAAWNASLVRVLEGHSLTYRKSIAYWIFQDVLRGYPGADRGYRLRPRSETREPLAEFAWRCLAKRAAKSCLTWSTMLFAGALRPGCRRAHPLPEPGQLRQQIFLAVRDLLQAEARQRPLLLVLEDLHWADDASLDLIRFLLESTRSAPLLISPFRAHLRAARCRRSTSEPASAWQPLPAPAPAGAAARPVEPAARSAADHPRFARQPARRQIIQRSAGLPFYLEEILRMLIENNIIYRSFCRGIQRAWANWRLTAGADVSARLACRKRCKG